MLNKIKEFSRTKLTIVLNLIYLIGMLSGSMSATVFFHMKMNDQQKEHEKELNVLQKKWNKMTDPIEIRVRIDEQIDTYVEEAKKEKDNNNNNKGDK